MCIVRGEHNKKNPYVMISKSALEDPTISWAAKGLLAYLLSLPDDWNIQVSHLSSIYQEKGGGEKAIYSLLNELIEKGYCRWFQSRHENGYYKESEYVIHEFKIYLPDSSQRGPVKEDPAEGSLTNKEVILKKEITTKESDAAADFQSLEQETTSKSEAYRLLEAVKLSHKDCLQISKRFPLEVIRNAIAWAIGIPEEKIKESLTATIVFGCQNALEPNKEKMLKQIKANKKKNLELIYEWDYEGMGKIEGNEYVFYDKTSLPLECEPKEMKKKLVEIARKNRELTLKNQKECNEKSK